MRSLSSVKRRKRLRESQPIAQIEPDGQLPIL
jgi:hypothetical protein